MMHSGLFAREEAGSQSEDIRFSAVYFIHGDANYLYHDSSGREVDADEKAFQQAQDIGRLSLRGEVFVFFREPKSSFLFFRMNSPRFIYFRNGVKTEDLYYTAGKGNAIYSEEKKLYDKYAFRADTSSGGVDSIKRMLLYYGHEIPESGGKGYNISEPGREFNINLFSDAVKDFSDSRKSGKPLDLIVLSTCNNGAPGIIAALMPLAAFIIASPEDLHLSFINSRLISDAAVPQYADTHKFAMALAGDSFQLLKNSTTTIVTISVYNTQLVEPFIKRFKESVKSNGKNNANAKIYDCSFSGAFSDMNISNGVDVFYRPPLFGRLKNKEHHSGWGCRENISGSPSSGAMP